MFKNFVIVLAICLLQFQQFAGKVFPLKKVTVFTTDGTTKIATGYYEGKDAESWTLLVFYEDGGDSANFLDGKTFKCVAQGFSFGRRDEMRYTVLSSQMYTYTDRPIMAVQFTTSEPITVQKNGDEQIYDAFHVAKNGSMFFNDYNDRQKFSFGDFIRYTSKAEENLDPRQLVDCPLRYIKSDRTYKRGFFFEKIVVTADHIKGILFSQKANQCVVEVINDKTDPDDVFKTGSTVTISWNVETKKNAKYTVSSNIPIPKDPFTQPQKVGYRFTFTKAG